MFETVTSSGHKWWSDRLSPSARKFGLWYTIHQLWLQLSFGSHPPAALHVPYYPVSLNSTNLCICFAIVCQVIWDSPLAQFFHFILEFPYPVSGKSMPLGRSFEMPVYQSVSALWKQYPLVWWSQSIPCLVKASATQSSLNWTWWRWNNGSTRCSWFVKQLSNIIV